MREVTALEIDTMYRTIGANVMRIRKQKGLSQLDLALAMGLKSVGLVSVTELYHNRKHFNLEHLYKISVVLDIPIAQFFGKSSLSPFLDSMKRRMGFKNLYSQESRHSVYLHGIHTYKLGIFIPPQERWN